MTEAQCAPTIEDQLAAAAMKVSEAHLLLAGVVDQAMRPPFKELAAASLASLEDAVRELRDVAVSLRTRSSSQD